MEAGGGIAIRGEHSETMEIHAKQMGIQKNQSEPIGCYGKPFVALDST